MTIARLDSLGNRRGAAVVRQATQHSDSGEGDEQGDQPRGRRFGGKDHPRAIFYCSPCVSRGSLAVSRATG
jgi:hypothetical protein